MLKIALLQLISAGFDQAANQAKGELFCRQAKILGADIALFPEMWNIGYQFFDRAQPDEHQRWQSQAIDQGAPFFRRFQALAKELDMAIALTYLEKWPERPRNAVTLIDRHGQAVLTYAKVHTCDFDVEAELTPGDAFQVCTLDTAQGDVQVGAMICYDQEFPESARILMLQGAEIILIPNSCEMEANRTGQLRARAMENMLGVALANYASEADKGHSVAFDGVAFTNQGSRDHCVIEAGEAEGVYLAQFDLERMRQWRSEEGWGNAYRKPSRYGLLVAEEVRAPFVRADAKR